MWLSKETRAAIKKAKEEIIYKENAKKELLSRNIDVNFLQELMNASNENQDLIITIFLHSGDKIVLTQKYKAPDKFPGYDGEPNAWEIR